MIPTYTAKPNDTFKDIADKFGVSVSLLKQYNAPNASVDSVKANEEYRNPKEKMILVERAANAGASIDQISKALKISKKQVIDFYGEAALTEVKPSSKNKKELKEIKATGKRKEQELFPIQPTGQRREQELFPVQPTGQRREQELFPVQATGTRKKDIEFKESPSASKIISDSYKNTIGSQVDSIIDPIKEIPGKVYESVESSISKYFPDKDVEIQIDPSIYVDKEEEQNKKVDEKKDSDFDLSVKKLYENSKERSRRNVVGSTRAAFQGLTLGFADEIEALVKSEKGDISYDEALYDVRKRIEEYQVLNPGTALTSEIVGAIPTSLGVGALGKIGVKLGTQGAIEAGAYGVGTGESSEERVINGITGAIAGYSIGRLVDYATSSKLPEKDIVADDALVKNTGQPAPVIADDDYLIDSNVLNNETYTAVKDPAFRNKPLSEATTVGELYNSVKTSIKQFYNDKIRGVSDTLWAEVSPDVGARYQRASETWLRENSKSLGALQERLISPIKAINENQDAFGALLDYSAGFLGRGETGVKKLREELSKHLSSEDVNAVIDYAKWSANQNKILNKNVFASKLNPEEITFLHTRLNKEAMKKIKEQKNLEVEDLEDLMNDSGFSKRTRGSYLKSDVNKPNPFDYDNPIVSDMQRIFKMQRLNQLKKMYGIDVEDYLSDLRNAADAAGEYIPNQLTPSNFMNALRDTLIMKGIPEDSANFARRMMVDDIMGQDVSPHPIVQALSSIAYATTLAGPMSAILNTADVPMVGAKYGGSAVKEGAKAFIPKKFKSIPDKDLKAAGFNAQNFGEFVSLTTNEMKRSPSFLQRLSTGLRKGTDLMMKGSGFAAMDEIGKKGVLRGILKSAADDAQAGTLADNWGFYFNKNEMNIIEDALKKHGDDWTKYEGRAGTLIEELMFAGLGQQQLISSAGRSAAWSRNPNLRPLWALRGFVIKQQALALREVVGNIKAGKPDEAVKFLGRYALYGAGGYAGINEGRQFIFGDGDVSAGGIVRGYGDAWASLLTMNTLGLNDYQFGKIKQNGLALTALEGLVPIAIDRPLDIGGRAIDVIDQKRYPSEFVADTLPLVKQSARAVRNIDELTGGMLGPIGETAEEMLERKPRQN